MKLMTVPMRKTLSLLLLFACGFVSAQTFTEWLDPAVNSVNRLPMHAHYFAYESCKLRA